MGENVSIISARGLVRGEELIPGLLSRFAASFWSIYGHVAGLHYYTCTAPPHTRTCISCTRTRRRRRRRRTGSSATSPPPRRRPVVFVEDRGQTQKVELGWVGRQYHCGLRAAHRRAAARRRFVKSEGCKHLQGGRAGESLSSRCQAHSVVGTQG